MEHHVPVAQSQTPKRSHKQHFISYFELRRFFLGEGGGGGDTKVKDKCCKSEGS